MVMVTWPSIGPTPGKDMLLLVRVQVVAVMLAILQVMVSLLFPLGITVRVLPLVDQVKLLFWPIMLMVPEPLAFMMICEPRTSWLMSRLSTMTLEIFQVPTRRLSVLPLPPPLLLSLSLLHETVIPMQAMAKSAIMIFFNVFIVLLFFYGYFVARVKVKYSGRVPWGMLSMPTGRSSPYSARSSATRGTTSISTMMVLSEVL